MRKLRGRAAAREGRADVSPALGHPILQSALWLARSAQRRSLSSPRLVLGFARSKKLVKRHVFLDRTASVFPFQGLPSFLRLPISAR